MCIYIYIYIYIMWFWQYPCLTSRTSTLPWGFRPRTPTSRRTCRCSYSSSSSGNKKLEVRGGLLQLAVKQKL